MCGDRCAEISALVNANRCDEGLHIAEEVIAQGNDSECTRQQAAWAVQRLVKGEVRVQVARRQANQPLEQMAVRRVDKYLWRYKRIEPLMLNLAHSYVLFQVCRIGKHLKYFVPLLEWCGTSSLRDDDFHERAREDGDRTFPSLACKLAREACAWIVKPPTGGDSNRYREFVQRFAEEVLERCDDHDPVWLQWGLVKLLRAHGNYEAAVQHLGQVLRRKKTEFWVWAEAGRVYARDQPELAIACFCRAFRCNAEPMFLGKARVDIALLLHQAEQDDIASAHVLEAVDVYDANDWRHPKLLQQCLATNWFDASVDRTLASRHSVEHGDEALVLCFAEIRSAPATLLGEIRPQNGQPLLRLACRLAERAESLVTRRGLRTFRDQPPGLPVTILLGTDDGRQEIIEVTPRADGQAWDCLDRRQGLVQLCQDDGSMRIYFNKNNSLRFRPSDDDASGSRISPGSGLEALLAYNPADETWRVWRVDPAGVPDHEDIRVASGTLRVNKPHDFGFVGDIFVPPGLMPDAHEAEEVAVVAIRSFNQRRNEFGWRAVAVRPSDRNSA